MNLFVALPNHAGERLSSPFPLTLHPYSSPRSPSQDSFEDNGNRSLKLVGLLMAFFIGNPVIVKNLRLSLEVLRKDGICSNLSSIKIPGGLYLVENYSVQSLGQVDRRVIHPLY